MKNILGIILVLVTSVSFAGAGEFTLDGDLKKKLLKNRRAKHPFGVNVYALGPGGMAGVSLDYFVVPKVSIEIGASIRSLNPDVSYFGGARYHFFGNTLLNTTPYVGVFSGFEYTGSDLRNFNLYIPVGIQRIKKNKITWSLEVAYQQNTYNPANRFYGGGKLGYRF